jgi:hypothetical protein
VVFCNGLIRFLFLSFLYSSSPVSRLFFTGGYFLCTLSHPNIVGVCSQRLTGSHSAPDPRLFQSLLCNVCCFRLGTYLSVETRILKHDQAKSPGTEETCQKTSAGSERMR